MNTNLKSKITITGVLALVLMVTVSGTALAAALQTIDTTGDFGMNEMAVTGTVSYDSPGVVITEGGSYETSVFQLSESPASLDYTVTGADAPVTINVYDGTSTQIGTTTVAETTSEVTGSIDLSSSSASDVSVEFDVPDDSDGTSGETAAIDSFSLQAPNSAPTVSVSAEDSGTALPGDSVTLNASASDADGDSLTYSWDLNQDGTFGDQTGQTVTVSESTAGDYTYTVQVDDGTTVTEESYTATFGTSTIEVTDINDVDGNAISNPEIGIWTASDQTTIVDYKEVTLPYTVEVAPGQDYNVWAASSDGDYMREKQVVSAVDGQTHSLTYTLNHAGVAKFNVVDESGTALDVYDVGVVAPASGLDTTLSFAADDVKEITEIEYGADPVELTFQKDGYQPVTKTYDFTDSNKVIEKNVSLEAERVLDFTVQDVDENAIEGATVELSDSEGTVVTSDTTDASGAVSIGGLSDQTYTVSVSATDYQSTSMEIDVTSDGSVTADMVLSSNVDEANGVTSSISYSPDTDDSTGGGVGFVGGMDLIPIIVVGGSIITIISFFLAIKD